MNYLVTGGAGFIGSQLIEELLINDHFIYAYDDLSSGYKENLPVSTSIKLIEKKIQDENLDVVPNIDGIFHLGAQASVPASIDNFYNSCKNNLLSSLKVFEIAKQYNVPVVYASSSAIYGNLPLGDDQIGNYEILSPYALDKLTLEKYSKLFFELYSISSIGLRFFNVYGPRQDPKNPYSGVISVFVDRFLKNLPVVINGGYQTRDFIYVKDVVHVLLKSMELLRYKKFCDFMNVGTGVSTTVDELFNKISENFDYKPDKIYKPLPQGDPDKSGGTFNKLEKLLDLQINNFTKIDFGLKQTIDYFRDIYDENI